MPTPQHQSGVLGEAFVAAWLQQQGWELVVQRWRCRWGELDVVARSPTSKKNQPKVLAFVEVKTRSRKNWDQDGLLALIPSKRNKLIRAAQAFLSEFPELSDDACRFDVAAVRCDHLSTAPSNIPANQAFALPDHLDLAQQCPNISLARSQVVHSHRLTLQHHIPNAFDLS